MAIYAKKLNSSQRIAMLRYERITGFEPMYQDEIDNGEMTFKEAWEQNVHWIESMWG